MHKMADWNPVSQQLAQSEICLNLRPCDCRSLNDLHTFWTWPWCHCWWPTWFQPWPWERPIKGQGQQKLPAYIYKVIFCFYNFLVKNFSSQLIHRELTLKLTESSFWGHWVTSQWTNKMTHTVSFQWVCSSHGKLAVSYSCNHLISSPCSGNSELTVSVANTWKAHSKLTVWAHLVSSLWGYWMSST